MMKKKVARSQKPAEEARSQKPAEEARSQKPEARRQSATPARLLLAIGYWLPATRIRLLLASGSWLLASLRGFWLLASLATTASAQPTQEQVLRSISENIDNQTGGPTRVLALAVAAAGLAILLVVLSQRRKREVAPKPFNHSGKLLREIARGINLKPAEIRQLKILAEQQSLSSPLTLLLCPSVLARAIKQGDAKVDRSVVVGAMRKIAGKENT